MEDMNDLLYTTNVLEGTAFQPVDAGGQYGGAMRLWLARSFMMELSYDRLTGTSEDLVSAVNEVDLDADLAMISFYFAPTPRYGPRVGFGGGAGAVRSSARALGASGSGYLTGYGPAFQGSLLLDVPVARNMAFAFDGGYRYSAASDVEIVGVPSNIDVDWSGFFARAGLALYLP
jgi:hypothetical protein